MRSLTRLFVLLMLTLPAASDPATITAELVETNSNHIVLKGSYQLTTTVGAAPVGQTQYDELPLGLYKTKFIPASYRPQAGDTVEISVDPAKSTDGASMLEVQQVKLVSRGSFPDSTIAKEKGVPEPVFWCKKAAGGLWNGGARHPGSMSVSLMRGQSKPLLELRTAADTSFKVTVRDPRVKITPAQGTLVKNDPLVLELTTTHTGSFATTVTLEDGQGGRQDTEMRLKVTPAYVYRRPSR
ncbi:MAG: hypothetical protein HY319_16835 [Armatimonadetes bacterium]|nr:hypothetical protein [Armatimonadota bacterium]